MEDMWKIFLVTLQSKSRWQKIRRNLKIGDIVLMKTSTIRNQWPKAKVKDVYKIKVMIVMFERSNYVLGIEPILVAIFSKIKETIIKRDQSSRNFYVSFNKSINLPLILLLQMPNVINSFSEHNK